MCIQCSAVPDAFAENTYVYIGSEMAVEHSKGKKKTQEIPSDAASAHSLSVKKVLKRWGGRRSAGKQKTKR